MSTEMPTKVEDFCVKRTKGSPRRLPQSAHSKFHSACENVVSVLALYGFIFAPILNLFKLPFLVLGS